MLGNESKKQGWLNAWMYHLKSDTRAARGK